MNKQAGKDFEEVSFSIFHITFVIAVRRTVPTMTDDKCNMENGK
jgi:hypothetical protein